MYVYLQLGLGSRLLHWDKTLPVLAEPVGEGNLPGDHLGVVSISADPRVEVVQVKLDAREGEFPACGCELTGYNINKVLGFNSPRWILLATIHRTSPAPPAGRTNSALMLALTVGIIGRPSVWRPTQLTMSVSFRSVSQAHAVTTSDLRS